MKTFTSEGAKSREKEGAQAGKLMCSRDARKGQIEREIAHHQRMEKTGLSMRQIAKRIGMSPSSHLMGILWEMADEKRLISKARDYRDGVAWDFRVPSSRLEKLTGTHH